MANPTTILVSTLTFSAPIEYGYPGSIFSLIVWLKFYLGHHTIM
jgi:hypothetical protein